MKNQIKKHLMEYCLSLFPNVRLDDVFIIACQNLFPSTYEMFSLLYERGLKCKNLKIIGKCYSTTNDALSLFKKDCVYVCPSSDQFDSSRAYDEQYKENATIFFQECLRYLKSEKYKKIIILDEGGELLLLANDYLSGLDNLVGIEQSSGYRKLIKCDMKFPIVNLARSKAKLDFESQIVVRSIIECLNETLKEKKIQLKKVLILGSGCLAQELAFQMKEEFEITTCGAGPSFDFSYDDLETITNDFDCIIGCRGSKSLSFEQIMKIKRDVILVSASISDREFDSVKIRNLVPPYADCHKHLRFKNLYFLHSGFPINFSPAALTLEFPEFELTRALILASIFQTIDLDQNAHGFVDLDEDPQRLIVEKLDCSYIRNK